MVCTWQEYVRIRSNSFEFIRIRHGGNSLELFRIRANAFECVRIRPCHTFLQMRDDVRPVTAVRCRAFLFVRFGVIYVEVLHPAAQPI